MLGEIWDVFNTPTPQKNPTKQNLLIVSLMIPFNLQSWTENGAYLRGTNYPNWSPLHSENIQYFNTYTYGYAFFFTLLEAPQWHQAYVILLAYKSEVYTYIYIYSLHETHIEYVKYIRLDYLV